MSSLTLTVTIETGSSNWPTGVITESEVADYAQWDDVTIVRAQEEDIFFEGSAAVSAKASNKAGEFYYDLDRGGAEVLDFDVAGAEEGELLFFNLTVTTLGALDTLANSGLTIRLYTDLNNYMDFVIAGTDVANDGYRNLRYGRGGYVTFALDPTLPGVENGTFDVGSITLVGIHIDTTSAAKAENVAVDGIFVGEGVRVTGTDANGWADLADYCSDHANRAWGMINYDDIKDTIYSLGKIYIGDSGQTAVTSLTDDSRKIKFKHTYYWQSSAWAPMVKDAYLGIEMVDAGGFATTWTDGIIVGTIEGRSGSLIEGAQEQTTYINLSGLTNASSAVEFYGTTFRGINSSFVFEADTGHKCFSAIFDACAQVNTESVEVKNCLFQNYTGVKAALLWNGGINIQSCKFINNDCAIEFPTAGTSFSFVGMEFSGNVFDVLNSTNATLTDSYSDSNRDDSQNVGDDTTNAAGQSFTGDGNILSRGRLWLQKVLSPTGNAVCKIYASTGSDPNRTPTGATLATSNVVDASTVGATWAYTDFEFEDEFTLVNTTVYFLVLEYDGDSSNYLQWGTDTSAPGHANNNFAIYTASWADQSGEDACFALHTDGIVKIGLTGGSDPSSEEYDETYHGATIMPISVNLTVRGVKSGREPNAYVRVTVICLSGGYEVAGTQLMLEVAGTVDDINAGYYKATESYKYVSTQPVRIVARYKGYKEFITTYQITGSDMDVTAVWQRNPTVNRP